MRKLVSDRFWWLWRGFLSRREAKSAAAERRQIEASCREHGMLWLVDERYTGMVPAPRPIQRRRRATR